MKIQQEQPYKRMQTDKPLATRFAADTGRYVASTRKAPVILINRKEDSQKLIISGNNVKQTSRNHEVFVLKTILDR